MPSVRAEADSRHHTRWESALRQATKNILVIDDIAFRVDESPTLGTGHFMRGLALAAYYEALEVLKKAVATGDVESLLEGEPVNPVFRPL